MPWAAAEQPNLVIILSDDMGFSDIGCYGGEIDTPHLDSLASGGLRLTQFYNTARCCPTRASLLTGLYPHQAGIGHMMNDRGYDGYRGELNRQSVTIPEALKAAGYRSYMAGKWHVTQATNPESDADKHNWPLQRGFDRFYGTIHGAGSFFDPNTLTRDNQFISPYSDPEYSSGQWPGSTYYYTDAIADHASRFVREHHEQSGEQPFFMYVAFTAAHWPMHALPEDIEKYEGVYDVGYDAIRDARYERMLQLGVIDRNSTVNWSLDDEWKETEHWEWDKRNMEVYAAMIHSMDRGIGRIVNTLRETNQLDNTLICFLQDNGGCAEGYGRSGAGGPRADQPSMPSLADDYLQPDMTPKQSRDGYPMRTGKGSMAGSADTAIGYGKGWATVSNTPFREYKHWTHEGGISTPLILHWPNRITKRRGQLDHTPGHLIDLMATAIDVAGADYPSEYHDGQSIKPMEGKSLVPLFEGNFIEREGIYWEHEGNRAIRVGDFKLVAKGAAGPWELYNIAEDRSEQHDLSVGQPEKVEQLSKMWQVYAERADVLPLNPKSPQQKNAEEEGNINRKQKRFELAAGDELSRENSPYVVDRGFSIQTTVDIHGDGVIVAQGGSSQGWSLYVQEGQLRFTCSRGGKRQTVATEVTLSGQHDIVVSYAKNGKLKLAIDGNTVQTGNVGVALKKQPIDGLQVGQDAAGSVAGYSTPFPLNGSVKLMVIEVD
ncbi:MAG: arylsulfatase [Planctomycetales bacterium]|nr:arylsulfatase [Planctomycetales bacterium]